MEVAVHTFNLDSLPTRPVCTPGSLINKFFCFDSTVVLTITPRVTRIAPAWQHIHSTCTGGNASIVSYPPADATLQRNILLAFTLKMKVICSTKTRLPLPPTTRLTYSQVMNLLHPWNLNCFLVRDSMQLFCLSLKVCCFLVEFSFTESGTVVI